MITDRRRTSERPESNTLQPLRLLFCHQHPTAADARMHAFAVRLSQLLGTHLNVLPVRIDDEKTARFVAEEVGLQYDLVLLGDELAQMPLTRLISQKNEAVRGASFLIGRRPAWPLSHILVVSSADSSDLPLIEWCWQLAHRAGSHVTVLLRLPEGPPQPLSVPGSFSWRRSPLLHSRGGPLNDDLQADADGNEMRISCTVQLNPGTPRSQVLQEVQKGTYDLVIVPPELEAAETEDGDEEPFLDSLLRGSAAPLLIAAPLHPPVTDISTLDQTELIYPN